MENQKKTYVFNNSGFRKFVLFLLKVFMGLIVDLEIENSDFAELMMARSCSQLIMSQITMVFSCNWRSGGRFVL